MLVDGTYDVNNVFGTFKSGGSSYYWNYSAGNYLRAYRSASSYYCDIWTTSNTLTNFSGYTKVKVTAYATVNATEFSSGTIQYSGGDISIYYTSTASVYGYYGGTGSGGTSLTPIKRTSDVKLTATPTEYIFDISDWTGEGYFGVYAYTYEPSTSENAKGYYVFITDIVFV